MPNAAPDNLTTFWDGLDGVRRAVNERLEAWLPQATQPPCRLHQAMRYSVFAGGKRVRPILAVLACRAVGGTDARAMPAACAIECIHTYSLIHDDLPAMDDDDFRRGRPSNHKAFDEATAILAGDALLTVAFDIISRQMDKPGVASRVVQEVAAAAGWAGMVGGQMADLEAEGADPDADTLHFIHAHKTGALIRASVLCGGLAGGAAEPQLTALGTYARCVGLAFQIADDLLDETATSEQLGKTAGKDKAAKKLTYPALYGLEASRTEARRLAAEAIGALDPLGPEAAPLARLAEFIVSRSS